jgi:hypothetical protein
MDDGDADGSEADAPAADRPDWWARNQRIREELDLPDYEPPRLADGTYTHEVVPDLEAEHDCTVRFIGINTTYPESWEFRVDGEPVGRIPRRRDANGNTVYGLTAEELRAAVWEAVE